MRVEVKNTSKRLTVLVANCPRAEAIKTAENLSDEDALEMAHYSEGDKVNVVVTGGSPAVTIYKRVVR